MTHYVIRLTWPDGKVRYEGENRSLPDDRQDAQLFTIDEAHRRISALSDASLVFNIHPEIINATPKSTKGNGRTGAKRPRQRRNLRS